MYCELLRTKVGFGALHALLVLNFKKEGTFSSMENVCFKQGHFYKLAFCYFVLED